MNPTYALFGQAKINQEVWAEIAAKHGLDPHESRPVLPHGKIQGQTDRIMWETRKLYFWQAVEAGQLRQEPLIYKMESPPTTRIVSWGNCNVHCPYCKRDCQFIGDDGLPIVSVMVPLHELLSACVYAHERGEIVRFSGGDPVMFPRETLAMSEYLWQMHGAKTSIAHNGSGTSWVRKLLPFLSSAAIDLKAVPEKMGQIMGISQASGYKMYDRSLATQALISATEALLDVRTPVFGDTTLDEMMRLAGDIVINNDLRRTFWTWRLYKAVEGCDWAVPEKDKVIGMMLQVSQRYPELWLGIRAKWQRGGMEYVRNGQLIAQSDDVEIHFAPETGSGNCHVLSPA